MAQKTYCGDNNNKARQIPDIGYCGDEHNKARKLLKGYCGDSNNKARQFWGSGDTSQKVLKPAFNWVPGGTHALDTCPPIMGVMGALNLGRKIFKPYLIINNALQYYGAFKTAVIGKFLSVQGNANVVYTETHGYYSSGEYFLYFWVRYGHVDNLQRTILSTSTSTQFGSTTARIDENIRTTNEFYVRLNLATGAIVIYDNGFSSSYNWIGVEVDSSTYATLNIRATNLGMTMYSVDMIYDWYWNFGSDNPMEDKVDGFKAFAYNCSSEFDGIVVDKRGSSITLPGFLFQTGRTVEIDFGEFDRHYTEYISPNYKYYEPCELFTIYNSNASQYSTHKSAGIILNSWVDNDPNEPYPKSHGVGLWGQVGSTYENTMGVNGLKNKKFQIVLHDTGGWRAGSFQFIYGGSAAEDTTFWLNVNNLYFTIGQSGAPGNPTAAYTFKVKSVAVY